MIGPVANQYGPIGNYTIGNVSSVKPTEAIGKVPDVKMIGKDALSVSETKAAECQTCKNRKYVDGSNDPGVSFKTPTHISPESSFASVSAHEQEHVANAYNTASLTGGRVVYASVSLKMAVCPECHTPYVEGGVTRTQIKYDSTNPYENNRRSLEGSFIKGMNVNMLV